MVYGAIFEIYKFVWLFPLIFLAHGEDCKSCFDICKWALVEYNEDFTNNQQVIDMRQYTEARS